ncbi:MAG: hypothetical protein V2A77_12215 [Pseudomonadota bacterium]
MKVIHLPLIIANNSIAMSKYLNRMGVDSTIISYFRTWLGYEGDINLDLDRLDPVARRCKIQDFVQDFLKNEARKYDIFHFHFFETLATGTSCGGWHVGTEDAYWDLSVLKDMGKKLVFSCFGSDVRNNSKITYYQLRYENPALDLPKPPLNTRMGYGKIWQLCQMADAVVAGDSEVLRHVPYGCTIPMPIDLDGLRDAKGAAPSGREKFSILHAPSNNFLKGSRYVLKILDRLKAAYGEMVEFRLIQGVPAQQALLMYPGRGVAIDQINMGFGLFALEAMYLGRPVFCSLAAEEFMAHEPKLAGPVISVHNEEELYQGLVDFIEGRRSVDAKEMEDYVVENHSAEKTAVQWKDLYEKVMAGEPLSYTVSPCWMQEFGRLIDGRKIDRDDYYSKVTDILLARRDADTLLQEIENGMGLGNDTELLAKMLLAHAASGRKEAAQDLMRKNQSLTKSPPFRRHWKRARGILEGAGETASSAA